MRYLAGLLMLPAAALLAPDSAAAQEASTMLVRVQSGGQPVAGVEFTVQVDGSLRVLATSGASGLAVVDFVRAPFTARAPVSVNVVTCGDARSVLFSPAAGPAPVTAARCSSTNVGSVVWYRTERSVITLGDPPSLSSTTATRVTESRTGLRVQAGPLASLVLGSELDEIGAGFGGEAQVGMDFDGGFGLGLAVSLARHDIQGLNESLYRWAIVLEPRYSFDRPTSRSRPYVSAQLGRQIFDYQSGAGLLTEKGWSYGAGGGIVFPLVYDLQFDLGAQFAFVSVGVADFDLPNRSGSLLELVGSLRF
ncbi:MAG: outer membrane beta-barrel protein [Gemmatimonadota bacterium]